MRYPAAIRESTDLQDVPVMALTADNRRETVQFVLSAGANDYTLKAIFHDNQNTFLTKPARLVVGSVVEVPIDQPFAKGS